MTYLVLAALALSSLAVGWFLRATTHHPDARRLFRAFREIERGRGES